MVRVAVIHQHYCYAGCYSVGWLKGHGFSEECAASCLDSVDGGCIHTTL